MEQNNISEQENDLQTNEKKDNKKTDEKESTAKTILEYVISIGIAIVAALLINNFILLNAKVPSGSMENTIMTGDRLFGFRLSYLMEDSKVYINDSTTPLKEDYLKEEWVIANDGMQFQVPEGCYFMMGDNRNNSKDSRYWNNTYVARDKILAKAIFRYWGGFKLLTNTADYE